MLLGQKMDYAIKEAKQQLKLIPLNKMKRQIQQLRKTILKRQKTEGQKANLPPSPAKKETEN